MMNNSTIKNCGLDNEGVTECLIEKFEAAMERKGDSHLKQIVKEGSLYKLQALFTLEAQLIFLLSRCSSPFTEFQLHLTRYISESLSRDLEFLFTQERDQLDNPLWPYKYQKHLHLIRETYHILGEAQLLGVGDFTEELANIEMAINPEEIAFKRVGACLINNY
ncbi:hypothetical protein [Bacillus sp. UMB0728]|uniref:hypothetical protein n=1 Tax=Bacillus sp. UMB0728 TaxID=2066052 RepID=UPI00115B7680|nr:hypothetical protein [Bacillus sp. UMB0728]